MDSGMETNITQLETSGVVMNVLNALIFNPVNFILIVIICVLVYKLYKNFSSSIAEKPADMELPKIRKDMTVEELRKYDGNQPDGRVLVAVNGWIFDTTRGRRFYGPGGPYAAFGGRDASRGLATFSVTSSDKEYDDLSDLNSEQMDSVREWEAQFRDTGKGTGYTITWPSSPKYFPKLFAVQYPRKLKNVICDTVRIKLFNRSEVDAQNTNLEKYDLVGRLLKPGEEPRNYSDEEPEETDTSTNNMSEDKKVI